MSKNNFKQFNLYNLLYCLVISLIIFFVFNNISIFNSLLGEINLAEDGINPKPQTCYVYFCRAAIIPFLYYLLLNFINVNFTIFLQIFLLVSIVYFIRNKLINLNLNKWVANFLFFILVFNPKFLKYSFSTQEESFYVPAILFGISMLFEYISNKNIKNLIYLNFAFALIVLIREAGIVFYFLIVIINFHFTLSTYNKNYKKKISLIISTFLILISPYIINNNLTNYLNSEKINNHYFSMHALTSLISKQEKYLSNDDDTLHKLINNRITKIKEIRKIEKLDNAKKLNFECIIYPAMNNLSYLHPKIKNFYENNYQKNLNKKLFNLYIENFINDPSTFIIKFHQCFFGNFLMVELLTKKEIDDMKKIIANPNFDNDDKRIIERFHKISKNYYSIVEPIRILNICIIVVTILSLIISIKSIIQNKNDKFAILSILFFCMYYLVIQLHVNLISVQVRWYFTYIPLLIFSNLKIIELLNNFISNKKNLYFFSKKDKI